MSLLDVRNLTASYGAVPALRNVSMRVDAGEIVAVIGANGAGKTTLLRTISGLLAPTAGDVELDGVAIGGRPAYDVVRLGVAHLPEGRELFRDLTVLENLHLGFWPSRGSAEGDLREQRIEEVFGYFPRLRERAKQRASTLSGGEAQMLGVARALMCGPRLLLVDELSLGLAPMVVATLFDILRQANERGMSLVIVEQFVHLALQNSHRGYVLAKGEVVATDASAALLADPDLVNSYLGDGAPAAKPNKPSPAKRTRRAPRQTVRT
jgi:branched-chain amino acid transport system ATP-binding protein